MTQQYIGKTLREVKAMHSNVRVTRAGKESFIVTMDHNPGRLNVEVEGDCLKYSSTSYTSKLTGEVYEFTNLDEESMEDAVVVKARFG